MSKHTKASWVLESDTNDGGLVWVIMGPSQDPDLKVEPVAILSSASKEDAQLIAAAPDLLAALKHFLREAPAVPNSFGKHQIDDYAGAVKMAVDAIAKAEGK